MATAGAITMAVKLETIRKAALALPETTEEPHHNFGSFRVRGKIFVTIPPGGELLHIFLPAEQRELALAMDPEFLEPVHWGSKVLGVRVKLPLARRRRCCASSGRPMPSSPRRRDGACLATQRPAVSAHSTWCIAINTSASSAERRGRNRDDVVTVRGAAVSVE
jgi:hypothetical protein